MSEPENKLYVQITPLAWLKLCDVMTDILVSPDISQRTRDTWGYFVKQVCRDNPELLERPTLTNLGHNKSNNP